MISWLRPNFLLTLLLLIAMLIFWINHVVVPIEVMPEDSLHYPNYVIEILSGIQVNHESVVRSTFVAKKMLHYRDEDVTNLKQPYFVNFEPTKPVMRLQANNAKLKGEDIFLTGDVLVSRGDGDSMVTMNTSYLHLIPSENIVTTNKMVTIKSKGFTVKAVGLILNNQTGVIELISQVTAVEN